MNKKIIIAAVVLLVLVIAIFGFGDFTSENGQPMAEVTPLGMTFGQELVTAGVENFGQPIEGFDAYLLLQAFPGLQASDFNGVESFEGGYSFDGQQLNYARTKSQPITSAEQTVSETGYQTLMNNVASRLDLTITSEQDITNLIQTLSQQ